MSEEQKIELLRGKVKHHKKLAYDSNKEDMLQNFYIAMGLNTAYEAVTGKDIFTIKGFASCQPDEMVWHLINQIDECKNNKIKKEKLDVKKELFLKNSILTDTSARLNEYYKELKDKNNINNNYKEYYLPRLLTPLPDRFIHDEEIKEIITEFLKQEEPEYKDIYEEMERDGRVFLLNGPLKSIVDYGGGCNGANYDYNSIDDTIVIKKHKNDLAKICSIAHELAHSIELLKLRKVLSEEDYLKYRLTTQYGEIYPIAMELKCQDFLEKNNLYKDEVKNIRTRALIRHKMFIDRMIRNIYGEETSYLENFNHDLEYTNATIGGIYLSNNSKELIEKFNKEKINSTGLEIFEKIGCTPNEFDKALTKQLKKCI